jgi:hypothetical protein
MMALQSWALIAIQLKRRTKTHKDTDNFLTGIRTK